jgi:hypothetical protein
MEMEMEIRGNGDRLGNGDRKIKKCTRTVHIFLRQYIGTTMHPAPIRTVHISPIFILFPAHCLLTQDEYVRHLGNTLIREKKNMDEVATFYLRINKSLITFG